MKHPAPMGGGWQAALIWFLLGVFVMLGVCFRPDKRLKWGGCYEWRLPVLRCGYTE